MSNPEKNILLFGANSFIAKTFMQTCSDRYSIHPVYRNKTDDQLHLDFTDAGSIEGFAGKINFTADAILFLQGINPSVGAMDMTEEHFVKMMKINLVTPTLILSALRQKLASNCLVLFVSSVAKRKGSYDPAYAAAKSGLTGLMHSLANAYKSQRFNLISLGLVEGSPVYNQMTQDFREKHASRMQNGAFIQSENVVSVINMLIENTNISRADIAIDGGFN